MRQLVLHNNSGNTDGSVCLTGKEYRYLIQVLRMKTGDLLNVRMKDGILRSMAIASTMEKNVILIPAAEIQKNNPEATIQKEYGSSGKAGGVSPITCEKVTSGIWLLQWMPKGQKLDQIIRQATEAGVLGIIPIMGEYSSFSSGNSFAKNERRERIIREARQQSGSPVETKLLPPATVSSAMEAWCSIRQNNSCALVLTEAPLARESLHGYLSKRPEIVALAVGSEGGVSGKELEILYLNGFFPVHFQTSVLRTETAALYGIAAVQTVITEYDSWHGNG